jgi:hypothetical protein
MSEFTRDGLSGAESSSAKSPTWTREECLRDEVTYLLASYAREIRVKAEAIVQKQLMNPAESDSSQYIIATAIRQVLEDHMMLQTADDIAALNETLEP